MDIQYSSCGTAWQQLHMVVEILILKSLFTTPEGGQSFS